MARVEIKSIAGAVLYAAEVEDSIPSGLQLQAALEKATSGRANLSGANLRDAYLRGANLGGAKLTDELTLVGERPVFTLGPIGSRADLFIGYVTNQGLRVRAGCFFGTPEEFTAALEAEHGTNTFAREYLRALELLELHAELYPAQVAFEAKAA